MWLQKGSQAWKIYFGLFKVIKRIGEVTYKFELPVEVDIDHVFYISVIKRFLGKPTQQLTPLQLQDCPD